MQCLHRSILHGWYSERTEFAIGLRDIHPAQRLGFVPVPLKILDGFGFRLRCGPYYSVHPRSLFPRVFSDSSYRQCFGGERVRRQPLQGFHRAPVSFAHCLRDTDLQPPHLFVTLGPVNTAPVHRCGGDRSRTSLRLYSHLLAPFHVKVPHVFSRS
jgi:hypothetical protein